MISHVEAYYELTLMYKQKGVSQLHRDFNKQKSNHQTSFHEDSLSMTFSGHRNGIASAITCNCGRNKHDKLYSNHQFTLNIPRQSKHHPGEFCYEAHKWYKINFQWVFGIKLIGGGEGIEKALGHSKYTLAGI